MEIEVQQARQSLREIAQAEILATRNSQNNGVIPLVWGVAILTSLIGFDVVPRLVTDPDLGLLVAGGSLWIIPVGAGIWTGFYRRRLPVQPRTIDRPRLYFWWGLYHAAMLCGGMALGFALAHALGRHSLPLGTFTVIGLADAAPLLWVGWTQRRRAQEARP